MRKLIKSFGNVYSLRIYGDYYGSVIKLFFYRYGGWTKEYGGKLAAKLHDFGDGITVKFNGGREINLDYSEIEELRILIREWRKLQK